MRFRHAAFFAAAIAAGSALADPPSPPPLDCFNDEEPWLLSGTQPESLRVTDEDLARLLARIDAAERAATVAAAPRPPRAPAL